MNNKRTRNNMKRTKLFFAAANKTEQAEKTMDATSIKKKAHP